MKKYRIELYKRMPGHVTTLLERFYIEGTPATLANIRKALAERGDIEILEVKQ